jgi:murein DD-endopeptidase MepM/ murein hydrolase activator NlpD
MTHGTPSGRRPGRRAAGAALLLIAAAAAGCGPRGERQAEVEIRGTDPGATGAPAAIAAAPAGAAGAPDAQGIVSYDGYQTVVAGAGDTVADLAGRVGLSASELAAYNGLMPAHALQAGDELVLPPRPGGYGTAVAAAPPAAATGVGTGGLAGAIEQAPLPAAGAAGTPPGGWSPEIAAAAIDRSAGLNPDGSLGAPPSSVEPVPPEPAPRRELESPDLGQYQTGTSGSVPAMPPPAARPAGADAGTDGGAEERVAAAAPGLRLQKPVEGPVAIPFNKGAGPARNDGVDFAAPAGAPVVAAADGEVALVSESLGGLGTIVLLRHGENLLTVYGRIDGVTVAKGDAVGRGQQIGVVAGAASGEPRMHFEVRRGAESLDPMEFL